MVLRAIAAEIGDLGNYYVSLDIDGLDPSIAPGTESRRTSNRRLRLCAATTEERESCRSRPRGRLHGQREPAKLAPPVAEDFKPVFVVPKFEPISEAPVLKRGEVRDQVTDAELVLGVVINGQARAYPVDMLTGPEREIINDTLGDVRSRRPGAIFVTTPSSTTAAWTAGH